MASRRIPIHDNQICMPIHDDQICSPIHDGQKYIVSDINIGDEDDKHNENENNEEIIVSSSENTKTYYMRQKSLSQKSTQSSLLSNKYDSCYGSICSSPDGSPVDFCFESPVFDLEENYQLPKDQEEKSELIFIYLLQNRGKKKLSTNDIKRKLHELNEGIFLDNCSLVR